MSFIEIKSPTQGIIGYLHEVECNEPHSILIFQLPRETRFLSETYISGAMDMVRKSLPEGRSALVIGCDVNVYELAEADAIILKLKGLI
jgi:hypothetical protein